ncbi:hypothetical protein ABIB38_004269 [Massilia sp. UYP11]|uniref:hypothetical protein n=1 Tax=Massilia sp. UYP11 TaxID=1756385 RepID=UPI003D212A8A
MKDDDFERISAEVRRLTYEAIEEGHRASILVKPGMTLDEVFQTNYRIFLSDRFASCDYGREFWIAYILELNGYEASIGEIVKRLDLLRKRS